MTTTSHPLRTSADAGIRRTAALLIAGAVTVNLAFLGLGSAFDYPEVLDEPPADVLVMFHDDRFVIGGLFLLLAVGAGLLAPIAGVAAWFGDRVKIVSVEPAAIPAMYEARRAGHPVVVAVSGLAADSLGAPAIGAVPFATADGFIDDAVLVGDTEIRAAQRALWETAGLMAEPGGATALACLGIATAHVGLPLSPAEPGTWTAVQRALAGIQAHRRTVLISERLVGLAS